MEKKINIYPEHYHWLMKGFFKEKYEYPISVVRKYLTDRAVVDVGCGDGRLAFLMSGYTRCMYGIDHQMVALKFARALTGNKIPLICGDGIHTPFKNSAFGVATLFDVIEHFPREFHETALKEIHRILRKDGVLIITTPNRRNLRRRVLGGSTNPKHYFEYSTDELQNMVKEMGFEILECNGIYLPVILIVERIYRIPLLKYLVKLMIRMGKYSPDLSETILIVSKKVE